MKTKIITTILLITLLALSINCSVETNINGPDPYYNDYDNHSYKLHGSGYLITKTLEMVEFNSIEFNIPGRIYIEQGDQQNVEITADDNIYNYLEIRVINDRFYVSKKSGVNFGDYHLTIKITMTDLERIQTNSVGSIEGTGTFDVDYLRLETNSVGSICIDVNAKEIRTDISSVGSVYLSGAAERLYASVNSIGSLNAFNLETKRSEVSVNSIGNAEVYAIESLEASVTSLGNLYYKGEPDVVILRITSLGRIIKVH
ncbi:MAG: DUF2807 domain-containing protein [bacterium]|nr:DUF2807 domain-containing protein [bacterium]